MKRRGEERKDRKKRPLEPGELFPHHETQTCSSLSSLPDFLSSPLTDFVPLSSLTESLTLI